MYSVCTLPGDVRTRESVDPKIVSSIYCLHRCAPLVTSVPIASMSSLSEKYDDVVIFFLDNIMNNDFVCVL